MSSPGCGRGAGLAQRAEETPEPGRLVADAGRRLLAKRRSERSPTGKLRTLRGFEVTRDGAGLASERGHHALIAAHAEPVDAAAGAAIAVAVAVLAGGRAAGRQEKQRCQQHGRKGDREPPWICRDLPGGRGCPHIDASHTSCPKILVEGASVRTQTNAARPSWSSRRRRRGSPGGSACSGPGSPGSPATRHSGRGTGCTGRRTACGRRRWPATGPSWRAPRRRSR